MTQENISISVSSFGLDCRPVLVVGAPTPCRPLLRGLLWPVPVQRQVLITQWFTSSHEALDIVYRDTGILEPGTPILAAAAGIVDAVGPMGDCGLGVTVLHAQNVTADIQVMFSTTYCHLSQARLAPGDRVSAGDVLGYSGDSGESSAPHLHFYVTVEPQTASSAARRIDPCTVLPDIPGQIYHLRGDGSVAAGCSDATNPEDCISPPAAPPGSADIVALICSMFMRAGATREQANIAVAVAAAESGLDPRARHVNTGPNSCRCSLECRNEDWGLFQINLRCHAEKLMQLGIIRTPEDLFDPVLNTAAAILISNGGRDWTPWATYNVGAHLRYLGQPGYTCP